MVALPTFFRKLQNVKNLVRPLSKKRCSRTPFDIQHVKDFQTVIATLFPKLQTVKDFVGLLFKKHRFRNSLENQHVKESERLVKSSKEHFHHIFSSLWNTLILNISPLVIC